MRMCVYVCGVYTALMVDWWLCVFSLVKGLAINNGGEGGNRRSRCTSSPFPSSHTRHLTPLLPFSPFSNHDVMSGLPGAPAISLSLATIFFFLRGWEHKAPTLCSIIVTVKLSSALFNLKVGWILHCAPTLSSPTLTLPPLPSDMSTQFWLCFLFTAVLFTNLWTVCVAW